MPLTTIITGTQKRTKDSFASSAVVGLAMRTNGEETPKVIDARGNVFLAGILAPTVAPTVTPVAGGAIPIPFAGGTEAYYGYVYVYASSRFPFVESDLGINGRLYPRSNASPSSIAKFITANRQLTVGSGTTTVTKTIAAGITTIWVFRTAGFATSQEASTAAAAGLAFFVAEVINDGIAGTVGFNDNTVAASVDQVQSDNFVAPQMQFVVYADPYWWGFGNMPFTAPVSWVAGTGVVTLTGTDTWFSGRNGQNFTLSGITTGGFDGQGTFKFLWLTTTTAQVTLDGVAATTLPTTAAGTATVQGPATTLYRSKPRNPFSWGYTQIIGSANVPQQFAFKVGGGLGTAIAVVPNNATLKLDCEYPAKCLSLNLRSAGTSAFEGTLRTISDIYSVSAHFSQFAAVTQQGHTVLWGMDFKNFAIVQSDGITQQPIGDEIPTTLRALTKDRTRQLLTHGCYDPSTELNCMWVSTVNGLSLVNYLIYQHAPTGFWGLVNEQDVLTSAALQDTLTGQTKVFVGTQTGLLGQAFVQDVWNNWLPATGAIRGAIKTATGTTITTDVTNPAFNVVDDGFVGNWVLVTDATGQQEQLARISVIAAHQLTFDVVRSLVGGGTTAFNPIPSVGWIFYIGLIECRLLKYFDFSAPQTDKQLLELWLTQQNVDTTNGGTLIRWYRERANTYTQFAALQNIYDNAGGSDSWFAIEEVPSELVKMFALEIINRGYQQWRFINMVLKPRVDP